MFIVPFARESRHLSRLFDAFDAAESAAPRAPALDVAESDAAYTVTLDMPGVAKQDVKVSVDGKQVTVQAEAQASDDRKEGDRIVYRERAVTRYSRRFSLPVELEQAEAGAKLEHGVLTLTLPKRGARSAAQVTIN